MVQLFVKLNGPPTYVLDLNNNYTISSKELMVKAIELYLQKTANYQQIEEFKNGDSKILLHCYGILGSKLVNFRSSNQYFNTDDLNNTTLQILFRSYQPQHDLDNADKESIKNILNKYY